MSDTPLLLAIHELNKWLDEQKELKSNLGPYDYSDFLDREIEVITGAITICRKFTSHDKPIENEVQ